MLVHETPYELRFALVHDTPSININKGSVSPYFKMTKTLLKPHNRKYLKEIKEALDSYPSKNH